MLEQEILKFLEENHSEDIVLSIEKYINQGEKYIKYTNQVMELKIITGKIITRGKKPAYKKDTM